MAKMGMMYLHSASMSQRDDMPNNHGRGLIKRGRGGGALGVSQNLLPAALPEAPPAGLGRGGRRAKLWILKEHTLRH